MALNSKLNSIKEYHIYITIIFLTLLGFFVRVYPIGSFHYHHDEIWHLFPAVRANFAEVFYTNLTHDGHPPLMYWVWHLIIKYFGQDIILLRLPSVIFGALTIPVAYVTGKQMFKDVKAGIFFAFFVSFCPLLVEQSQVIRGYSVAMFFAFGALFYSLKYYETKNFVYFGLQFISLFFAFLSEFAIIPVAVATAIITLKAIYLSKENRVLKLLIWAITNIFLLAYLFWFKYMMENIGGLDFSKSPNFTYQYHNSLNSSAIRYFLFFINFFMDFSISNFYYSFLQAKYFLITSIFEMIVLLSIFLWGLKQSFRENKLIFLAAISYFILVIIFDLLRIIPINMPRRNIGLVFVYLTIIYSALKYIDQKYLSIGMACITGLILASYIIEPSSNQRWYQEYDITKEEYQEYQNFLDENISSEDIILTDWLTYNYFTLKGKNKEIVNSSFSKFGNFYTLNADYRSDTYLMNQSNIQEFYKKISGKLKYKNIWIIGVGAAINPKSAWLYKRQLKTINSLIGKENQEKFSKELVILKSQHKYLKENILLNSDNTYISCRKPEHAHGDCQINLFAISITKENFEKILEGQPEFINPREFLENIRQRNI